MGSNSQGDDLERIIFYRTTASGRKVRVSKLLKKTRLSNNNNHGTNIPEQSQTTMTADEVSTPSSMRSNSGRPKRPETDVYVYTICNGLSNQLLHHAAHISKAQQLGYQRVAIPNHFIIQGTQTSNANVGVTKQNSVPFTHVFDGPRFLHIMQTQLQLQGHFVDQTTTDTSTAPTDQEPITTLLRQKLFGWNKSSETPSCLDLSRSLDGTDPVQVRIILQSAFRPSRQHMEPIVQAILQRLPATTAGENDDNPYSQGVCLHDRNGKDWIDHCKRWSSIPDGVYRGNCLPYLPKTKDKSSSSRDFLENLRARVFTDSLLSTQGDNPSSPERWVYYCGDYPQIPSMLLQASASYQSNSGILQNTLSFMGSTRPQPLYSHITSRQLLLQQEEERQKQQQSDDSSSWSFFGMNQQQQQEQQNNSTPTISSPSRSNLHDLFAQQQHIMITQYGFSSDSNVFDLHRDARDFWALLDFYVCRSLPRFVGNSVSTFSAIQIALRQPLTSNLVMEQQQEQQQQQLVQEAFTENQSSSSSSSSSSWSITSPPQAVSNGTAITTEPMTTDTHGALVPSSKTTTLPWGAAYWYNSQSIPLGSFWKAFDMPIVYTFTEQSMASGKYLLQASIASVRRHMPHTPIHMLYNGHDDVEFRTWLQQSPNHVIIHDHNPTWAADIEEMRVLGDVTKSHLFQHAGNYLGTWQRIDVPLFVDSEYALLLDSDTIVQAPFTLDDFGLDLTRGIAMSSETQEPGSRKLKKEPSNAGVLLMNIPFLRQTHKAFLEYIIKHKDKGGQFKGHPCPSDQGAYLTFYAKHVRYLDYKFNMKPYIALPQPRRRGGPSELEKMKIVHFHGPKPHDYINYMVLDGDCPKASHPLCVSSWNDSPQSLCHALSLFAQASLSVSHSIMTDDAPMNNTTSSSSMREMGYCQASFPSNPKHAQACQTILQALLMASYQNEVDGGYSYGIPKICSNPNKGDFVRFLMASLVDHQPTENSSQLILNEPRMSSKSWELSSSSGKRSPTRNTIQPNAEVLGHRSVIGTAQSPIMMRQNYKKRMHHSPSRLSSTFYMVFVLLILATLLCSWTWFYPTRRKNKKKKTISRRRRRQSSSSSLQDDGPNDDHEEEEKFKTSSLPPQLRFLGRVTRLHILIFLGLAFCLNNFWQFLDLSMYNATTTSSNNNNSPAMHLLLQESREYRPPTVQQNPH